jgi:hypothetical protein
VGIMTDGGKENWLKFIKDDRRQHNAARQPLY